jgi:HD-GYP domain-containing protein (c-di-GMP phosphodiesterase class II)
VIMDNILRKPRQLTEEEFELIRTHPVVGDKILKPLGSSPARRRRCVITTSGTTARLSGRPQGR